MTTAIATTRTLLALADANFLNTGIIGQIALLSSILFSGGFSANTATDLITTAAPHGLITGSRVRVSASGGSVPGGLLTTQDYWAIVVTSTSLKLAATANDADNNISINLLDSGTGSLSLNEQDVTALDALPVLLNKELSHPIWAARAAISAIGPAVSDGGEAAKPVVTKILSNTSASTLAYKHVLILFGAATSSVIGSIAGISTEYLVTETSIQSIAVGETKNLNIEIRVVPA